MHEENVIKRTSADTLLMKLQLTPGLELNGALSYLHNLS